MKPSTTERTLERALSPSDAELDEFEARFADLDADPSYLQRGRVDDDESVDPALLRRLFRRPTDGSDLTDREVARFLAEGHDADLERRVLAWLARNMKRGLHELDETEVFVLRQPERRTTRYAVVCLPCEIVAPRRPSKRDAEILAVLHLREAHESVGTIRTVDR